MPTKARRERELKKKNSANILTSPPVYIRQRRAARAKAGNLSPFPVCDNYEPFLNLKEVY